jgi:acetyl esterase/lipase
MQIRISSSIVGVAIAVLISSAFASAVLADDSKSDERLKRLLQRAPQADTNKDGVLTLKEAQAYLKAQRAKQAGRNRSKAKPTHANIKYGDHERHAIDLYLTESKQPTPLVIYIHGGGFVGGNKTSVSGRLITAMHAKGISVAAIHYRFIGKLQFPVPFTDSARAVQFLRQHAKKYNLDADRFAATGGSAGAGISLWLATRDEMADPVSRQSTRISCASVNGAQVSYDPRFWRSVGLAKGLQHRSFSLMFGVPADDPFDDPKLAAVAEACAPIEHVTKDDPPVYFSYGAPDELNEKTSLGAVVHHPRHGQIFKKKMDSLGVECHVVYPGSQKAKLSSENFLIKHLTAE